MYVTTRFVGTKRGTMNYLFFLLTEDYLEENNTCSLFVFYELLASCYSNGKSTGFFLR